MVDHLKLRLELTRQRLAQWRLAHRLGLAPSTLSDYLRGARPAPARLQTRIERALGLSPASLDSPEDGR